MNIVTIKFGQGTEAWGDMQEVAKVLQKKGYSVEPYEEIGTVKLVKKINDEIEDKINQRGNER
ncbi:hypothetical protein CN899_10205 [Bacillus thuringiensis]|uniref:DUF8088 domain-containing protein n=1 Tax=Bacillus thuringiensis TaxID=1428 RepID=A0A9X7C1H8_BACTU|nr:hypothetical protein [Bacillus thuringiensis]PGH84997.1 hypothetical protein CN899_10205 [Bacillus thuringiensis]